MGGHLLRLFFAPAGTSANGGAVELHLDEEALVVVGPLFSHQAVQKDLPALPLDQLLKGGLVVQRLGQTGNLSGQDEFLDKLPG